MFQRTILDFNGTAMKYHLFYSILLSFITNELVASPRGKDYSVRDEIGDGSAPTWFMALFAIVGYVAYQWFDDGKKESLKGCLASIIAMVILFAIIYIINH